MKYQEETVELKDGRQCILRSPDGEDAEAMLAYLRQVSDETHFMIRYPEEAEAMTLEREKAFLAHQAAADTGSIMINAIVDGKVVGNVGLSPTADMIKLRHRASIGIAIIKDCWGLGLGTLLMEEALREAKKMKYYQVELGVYADNERALRLYEKLGFERWGVTKNAFRLKDGAMIDEILMGKVLK